MPVPPVAVSPESKLDRTNLALRPNSPHTARPRTNSPPTSPSTASPLTKSPLTLSLLQPRTKSLLTTLPPTASPRTKSLLTVLLPTASPLTLSPRSLSLTISLLSLPLSREALTDRTGFAVQPSVPAMSRPITLSPLTLTTSLMSLSPTRLSLPLARWTSRATMQLPAALSSDRMLTTLPPWLVSSRASP